MVQSLDFNLKWDFDIRMGEGDGEGKGLGEEDYVSTVCVRVWEADELEIPAQWLRAHHEVGNACTWMRDAPNAI